MEMMGRKSVPIRGLKDIFENVGQKWNTIHNWNNISFVVVFRCPFPGKTVFLAIFLAYLLFFFSYFGPDDC